MTTEQIHIFFSTVFWYSISFFFSLDFSRSLKICDSSFWRSVIYMVLNGLSKFEVSRVKTTLHAKLSVSSEICMRLDLRGGLFFPARAVSWNDVCMEQSCWLSKYWGKWFGYAVTRVHFHTWRQPVQPRCAASLPWWLGNFIILMTLHSLKVWRSFCVIILVFRRIHTWLINWHKLSKVFLSSFIKHK